MTSQKMQKCIPVINDINDEQFQKDSENFEDPKNENFTSIWRHPERLQIPSDYSLLLSVLSRELQMESNYSETLNVLKIMKNMENSTKNGQKIEKIFNFLLLQLLREENSKKIDPHQILDWLDSGDRLFSEERSKKSMAILKLYFLCRNRKSKLECFSCGCVQKYFIELYTENSNSRLIGALTPLITGRLTDLEPVLRRLFLQLPEISSIEYYEYYIELLGELEMCSVIDKQDENKHMQRVIQLIGLLSELRLEDVPKACSKLYTLMGSIGGRGEGKKKSSAIETVVRKNLLPKIFDSLTSSNSPTQKMDFLSRNSVQKMMELVVNEKYSYAQQANIMFAPLQFLNRIMGEFDVWLKSWPLLSNRLESLKMSTTPNAPIVFLYFTSLVYRNDPSLVGCLVEYLEQQYQNSTTTIGVKKTLLLLLEILETISGSAPSMSAYFKENHPKQKMLQEEPCLEITLDYIPSFSDAEINQYLSKKSINHEEFLILIEKLKDLPVVINSDGFWRILMEKIDENGVIFIENQLKILINRGDRKSIHQRVEQILKRIKCAFSEKLETSTMELWILNFPRILMDFSEEEWRLWLPASTGISLISVAIFGFLTIFEGNESQIHRLFCQLHSHLCSTLMDPSKSPLEILEEFCQKIRSKTITGSLEMGYLKDFDKESGKNPETKKRILKTSAILWENLAGEFQKEKDGDQNGDQNGLKSFCQLADVIDEYLKNFEQFEQKSDSKIQIWRQISEKTMEGYAKWYTEGWNWLYVSRKIWTVLNTARRDAELVGRLMRILNQNQALLSKLRTTNKEFVQLERSVNS